jgi:hypothetical protein
LDDDCTDFTEAIVEHPAPIAFGGAVTGPMAGAACWHFAHVVVEQGELQLHGFHGFHGSRLSIESAAHQGRTALGGTRGEIISPGVPIILRERSIRRMEPLRHRGQSVKSLLKSV